MVIPTKFIKQTRQLEIGMTQMGQDCLKGLWCCRHALMDSDKTLVQAVDELHEEVSTSGRDCEQVCMRILLLQHPVAKDLRRITVATNTIRDITRIMDQLKEVSDLICEMNISKEFIDDSIKNLFDISKNMIDSAINAFMQKDEAIAHEIILMDDKADQEYIKAKDHYVEKLTSKEYETGTLVNLLLIGKYLERICDHATNIAKWVLYQKSGNYEE